MLRVSSGSLNVVGSVICHSIVSLQLSDGRCDGTRSRIPGVTHRYAGLGLVNVVATRHNLENPVHILGGDGPDLVCAWEGGGC